MQLVVLGGSSPFTLAFIRALALRANELPRIELVIVGRNATALSLVGHASRNLVSHLGWNIRTSSSIDESLPSADVIVQQIRFGDMAGRSADEDLAKSVGCFADETLGPAALRRALRIARPMQKLGRRIAELAPNARVWNLSNPLSACTSLLASAGVRDPIGICELPRTTARRAGAALGVAEQDLSWQVVGLNHRAFIVGLACGERDLFAELIDSETKLPWTSTDVLRELGAVPTKYYSLLISADVELPAGRNGYGRGANLEQLRQQLFTALQEHPERLPRALSERVTDWYDEALVPSIVASCSDTPERLVIDRHQDDGLCQERMALISRAGIVAVEPLALPTGLRPWIQRFEAHERELLGLLADPGRERLITTLAADPGCPDRSCEAAANALIRDGSLEACYE